MSDNRCSVYSSLHMTCTGLASDYANTDFLFLLIYVIRGCVLIIGIPNRE